MLAFQVRTHDEEDDDALSGRIAEAALRRADDPAPSEDPKGQSPESNPNEVKTPDDAFEPVSRVNDAESAEARLLKEQSAAIDMLAQIMDQSRFEEALHAFANSLAQAWSCQRVTIGFTQSNRVRIEAVSGQVDFDRRSALMVDIAEALQETVTVCASIGVPADDSDEVLPQAHLSLASQLKRPALLSLPLVRGESVNGAMLLERDRPFDSHERQQLESMVLLFAPVLSLKRIESLTTLGWLRVTSKRRLGAIFGRTKLGFKLLILACCALVVWAALHVETFRVDADASIEAHVERAVVANYPSFIAQVEKRNGDVVQRGDVLARLDVEELELSRIKWLGERDKLAKEYRATLAQRDRSQVRILEARRAQAQSQIDLIDAQMKRAVLRAPIDGVVISGDLSQALGSPVDRGELLFEVASLEDYRLIIMVDERDIGWIKTGEIGALKLRSLPEQTFEFTVQHITPVSEASERKNRFRVEGTFILPPSHLRPGMRGVAKIEIGERSIGWIWTRKFVDWLKVQRWRFGL